MISIGYIISQLTSWKQTIQKGCISNQKTLL